MAPPALHPLKVAVLPALDVHADGSAGGGTFDGAWCDSPSTPVSKPGIKERMKFYFQRQAGGTEFE